MYKDRYLHRVLLKLFPNLLQEELQDVQGYIPPPTLVKTFPNLLLEDLKEVQGYIPPSSLIKTISQPPPSKKTYKMYKDIYLHRHLSRVFPNLLQEDLQDVQG